jgi:Ca2+-binding EF-hand superfamily protein
MKKTAGLLVATGLLVTASYSFGKPPAPKAALPASKKSAQSKSTQSSGAAPANLESAAPTGNVVWAAADRDGDGTVSFGEFTNVVNESIARRVTTRFRQLDRNKDGLCTRAEVNKMGVERFARFDTNNDGLFTAAELAAVMREQVASRLQQLYVQLDVDKNGSFSVAELTPPARSPAKAGTGKAKVVASRGPSSVQ